MVMSVVDQVVGQVPAVVFDVPAAWLQAVEAFVSREAYHVGSIGGAVIVRDDDGAVVGVVGSDSYVLGAVGRVGVDVTTMAECDSADDVWLSADVLSAVRRFKPATSVRVVVDADTVTVQGDGVLAGVDRVDGTFPDWRRMVTRDPRPEDDRDYGFNLDFLGKFAKAHRLAWKSERVSSRPNPVAVIESRGRDAARVTFPGKADGPVVSGLIMPCRV